MHERNEIGPGSALARGPRPRRRRLHWILAALPIVLLLLLAGLFTVNGLWLARGATAEVVVAEGKAAAEPIPPGGSIKILAYNIAKCFVHRGGLSFVDPASAQKRLGGIAALIEQERPDLVFLSEAVFECGPCPIDQVDAIARATGMHAWAYGENYNAGFPLYRVAGGNAILSRRPIHRAQNRQLPGQKPFYITKNNRRVLSCVTPIGGHDVLLFAVHNDAFDADNNLRQTRALLEYAGSDQPMPAILAGDFNARPGDPSMELIRATGQYTGHWDGPVTFPSDPQTIDYVFVPPTWRLLEQRVIQSDVSDHYPIVATFEVRWES